MTNTFQVQVLGAATVAAVFAKRRELRAAGFTPFGDVFATSARLTEREAAMAVLAVRQMNLDVLFQVK